MDTSLIGNALVPVFVALAGLAVLVFGGYSALARRMDREIKRSDAQRDELMAENTKLRAELQNGEDARYSMKREMATLRGERDELRAQFDGLSKQFEDLYRRVGEYEKQVSELRFALDAERRDAQRRIDAEVMAKQVAQTKAVKVEAERDVLLSQKDALEKRLEDANNLHAAEITSLKLQIERLESESRLLFASIDSRIQAATGQPREQVQALMSEREALELRVHELENKGVDPDA